MFRTMVQLTGEQVKALKALAKTCKTSVAKLVHKSMMQYVGPAQKEPTVKSIAAAKKGWGWWLCGTCKSISCLS
ncbi:MAG: hypothetical protein A2W33_10290 [Chloroflexi bacterium RBG_16_52_11]|nr:MAG: hypothetical protein A2W33_10290 [Chloroflexi bacterium RBG_16_52_11]